MVGHVLVGSSWLPLNTSSNCMSWESNADFIASTVTCYVSPGYTEQELQIT